MQLHTVGSHKTTIANKNGTIVIRYQKTDVVTAEAKKITLKTDGWKTTTTKARMNQASNQFALGFTVYQKAKKWFVIYKNQVINFDNESLILDR